MAVACEGAATAFNLGRFAGLLFSHVPRAGVVGAIGLAGFLMGIRPRKGGLVRIIATDLDYLNG